MKKILILTSQYLPKPSANGINTKYIVDELVKRGYDVSIMSYKNEKESDYEFIDNVKIYRITKSLYSNLLELERVKRKNKLSKLIFKIIHLFRKLKLTLLIWKFPNFDFYQNIKTYRKLNKIYNDERFDCIIGVFKPYSNIYALKRFKRNNKNVLCIGYYLDLMNSHKRPKIMPKALYKHLILKEEISNFKALDYSFIPDIVNDVYSSNEYYSFVNKIQYVDFPTFLSFDNLNFNTVSNSDKIKFIYAGTLDKEYRNPRLMLKSLQKISKYFKINIELDVYGKNNCDEILNEYNYENLKINNLGIKNHNLILKKMMESDFIINISNKLEDAIPSKIFEIFSFGKPVINYVFDKNDKSKIYFEKYPLTFNFNEWNNFEESAVNLKNFIMKNKGKVCDYKKNKELFKKNTPEYTVNLIENNLLKFY
ncbi:glycosyltransferase [Clostridium perfringens]|uniref:glycosyltransferase n=1 Tax=Clostridium perfringens TaxID=1502 RepID=UPI0018E4515E|nr:hypothetical protein [Clostridium perfringens]MDM0483756.1 glycosyltransferase [Clostridium perfringens]